jgi:amino acid permease
MSTSALALLRTTGIVIFAFSTQAQVPNLFAELAPPPAGAISAGGGVANRDSQEAARVLRMKRLLLAGGVTMAGLCWACGVGGYVHFGDRVESNVLEPFPLDDHLINVARLAMVLVASVSYPVIHFTARLMLHDLTPTGSNDGGGIALQATFAQGKKQHESAASSVGGGEGSAALPMSAGRRRCFTIVFYIGALTLALLTSDLGELFTIFGSLCGWATLFAVPGALLLDRAGAWAASPLAAEAINGVTSGNTTHSSTERFTNGNKPGRTLRDDFASIVNR